jgi:hypothetical protein
MLRQISRRHVAARACMHARASVRGMAGGHVRRQAYLEACASSSSRLIIVFHVVQHADP